MNPTKILKRSPVNGWRNKHESHHSQASIMTTTAPNLGKLFTSCTKRPATTEDIALLAPGDWISERECPWSWQFKNSCQDMAIGVWEGKEFFVPHHLLMVCEIIEGEALEKFFKKPEPKFKVGDRVRILKTRTQNLSQWIGKTALVTGINGETLSVAAGEGREKKHLTLKKGWYEIAPLELAENERTQQFKVGDRVEWRDAPESIYQVIKPERGGHVTIELVKSSIKPKPPQRTRVPLWEIQFSSQRPSIGTDLGFKVGDRVVSKHPLCLGQVFEIAKYPNVYANGSVSYESLVTTTDLVLGTDQVSLVENNQGIKIGDRFAVTPGVTNECEIIDIVGDKYRVRWSLKGDEMEVDAVFLARLKSVQPDLEPEKLFTNESETSGNNWNPKHFGSTPHQIEEDGQTTIFYDTADEPPDPDDFKTVKEFEEAWKQWELRDVPSNFKFAYKQLRQKGINHQQAITILKV